MLHVFEIVVKVLCSFNLATLSKNLLDLIIKRLQLLNNCVVADSFFVVALVCI